MVDISDYISGSKCNMSGSSSDECAPWQLTKSDEKEAKYMTSLVSEHINIGGANVNVFQLLGVHEQGQLIDRTGKGSPISSGSGTNFDTSNAFDIFQTEWRSSIIGQSLLTAGYIGYDFGEIKLDNDRVRYGIETSVKYNIATIRIKQGSHERNRVSKVRIERSNDGEKWYGVVILSLPNDSILNTIHFKHSVPSRYWRIRPTQLNTNIDYWAIQALELIDYDSTSIDDIQDEIFQENRDRDYATSSVRLKAQYDLQDSQSELTMFGIELPSQSFYLQMAFTSVVEVLGRPIVIGDILELPSEAQYSFDMKKIKKFIEVTDVSWAVDGYTPGWTPTLLRVIAQPMIASQENMDLFDSIADETDDMGLSRYGLKNLGTSDPDGPVYQDADLSSQNIESESDTLTPEMGTDTQDSNIFSDEQISNVKDQGVDNLESLNYNQVGLYMEDALPPNGIDYTEGDTLPDISVSKDGQYHRLTYSGINKDIPARLFKFYLTKNRWIFMESDKRALNNPIKPRLLDYYASHNGPVPNDSI